jgi:hypothetical protein
MALFSAVSVGTLSLGVKFAHVIASNTSAAGTAVRYT